MRTAGVPARLGKAAGGGWRPHWPPPGARYTSGKRRGRTPAPPARHPAAPVGIVDDDANLRFVVPEGAYAGAPAWRSRTHYLAALRWHPRLETVCKSHGVRVGLFLSAMALYAARADVETGRNIAVANDVLARLLGCTDRHVRNITRAARELGVQHVARAGSFMTGPQRWQVLDAYRPGHHSRTWRNLPNYVAATVPAELVRALHRPLRELRARLAAAEHTARAAIGDWHAARLFRTGPRADCWGRRGAELGAPAGSTNGTSDGSAVDNSLPRQTVQPSLFRLPVGDTDPAQRHLSPYETPLFQTACGQTPAQRAEQYHKTAATRPTEPHRQKVGLRRRGLNPDLEAFALDFRAVLPGFQDVSVRRIANALSPYRRSGLNADELAAGLRTYLTAHHQTLYRTWEPHEGDQQARYLVRMLNQARDNGFLVPDN